MICIYCNSKDVTTYTKDGKGCCRGEKTSFNGCNDCKAIWKETEKSNYNNNISPFHEFMRSLMTMRREDLDGMEEEVYGNGKGAAFAESCKHLDDEEIWKEIGEDLYGNGKEAAFVEYYENILKNKKNTTNKAKSSSCKTEEPALSKLCNDLIESLEKVIPFMQKLEARLSAENKKSE